MFELQFLGLTCGGRLGIAGTLELVVQFQSNKTHFEQNEM